MKPCDVTECTNNKDKNNNKWFWREKEAATSIKKGSSSIADTSTTQEDNIKDKEVKHQKTTFREKWKLVYKVIIYKCFEKKTSLFIDSCMRDHNIPQFFPNKARK